MVQFIIIMSDQRYRLLCGAPRLFSSHTTYMGAPSNLFLRILYGGPLRSVSLLTVWGPPSASQFFCLLCGPGHPRSVSSHTIWGPPSHQFLCLLYRGSIRSVFSLTIRAPPQVSFFAYYMGHPQISFFAHTIWGSSQTCFFAYYMEAPSDQSQFLRLLYGGPLRPVSSLTIWGPPPDQFLCILYGGLLQISFFA